MTLDNYQRGYAWEEKQWRDFVQDIDALLDDKIKNHYTGTIVIYPKNEQTELYGTKKLEVVDIVDGQQRITTCSLYLSIILNTLIELGENAYQDDIPYYLYSGSKSKLLLNNDTSDFFYDLISKGNTNTKPSTIHQARLMEAYTYLKSHVNAQLETLEDGGVAYLKNLFDAIIRKLNFSFYTIEEESEIGMTFELMNSRGKDLSSLELLKNYLMYWVYRNVTDLSEKQTLTDRINKSWKEIFVNISDSDYASENQCLRIAWTLYVFHTPNYWNGYEGFKQSNVIPIRDFSKKDHLDTQRFITKFTDGLAEISRHYSEIVSSKMNSQIADEHTWLAKIKNAGNIANYLPLMIAIRQKVVSGSINAEKYITFLKNLELFSYRVFLWERKRSNTAMSQFFRWAEEIFSDKHTIDEINTWILGTINWYSHENSFRDNLENTFYDWYYYRRLLKYTLYEYELWLLETEGKGNNIKIEWSQLSDATFEHILPQNPDARSEWLKNWSDSERKQFLHDISNLVLTKDNSHYNHYDFARKRGRKGDGHCYYNSDIRQERKIADYDNWTVNECRLRRKNLISWIIDRWGIEEHFDVPDEALDLKEDGEE